MSGLRKYQAPTSKHQRSSKPQAPSGAGKRLAAELNPGAVSSDTVWPERSLIIEAWMFSGGWMLVFGASAVHASTGNPSSRPPFLSWRSFAFKPYLVKTAAAWLARFNTVFGNNPSQKMPAMQIQIETLAGAESSMGDKSAGSLLQ